ncbi:MAG TPA: hypothetical protein DIW47_00490 [Bacteroidetes bacterium]|nr:hypothetical protein [Bacteroidota bacterium]
MSRIGKKVWKIAGGFFILFCSYAFWYLYQLRPLPETHDALQNSAEIKVSHEDYGISFTPTKGHSKVLLFYPGAFVDVMAYAPLCRAIAKEGIRCVLIKMPLRLALFGYHAPQSTQLFADTSNEYILAGHSHGAEMAAHYIKENPGRFQKLILLGTQYPEKISLADNKIKVLKVYGTNDGLEPVAEVEKNKVNLPAGTRYVEIVGGNHGQFGYYGKQPFDNRATISREEQQKQVVQAMLDFIFD